MLIARQRAALLDLPTENDRWLRLWTLADDDLETIRTSRRLQNRFGFLCTLQYSSRLLASVEVIWVAKQSSW